MTTYITKKAYRIPLLKTSQLRMFNVEKYGDG